MQDLTRKMPIDRTEYSPQPYEVLSNPYELSNPYDDTHPHTNIPPAPPRLKPKKRWGLLILVLLLLLLIPGGIGAGYFIGNAEWQIGYHSNTNSGYQSGYNQGKATGYSSGKAAGYQTGYTTGHLEGYNSGQSDGYNKGKTDGYAKGKADGYSDGFTKGGNNQLLILYSFLYNGNTSTGLPCKVASIIDNLGNSDYRNIRMYQDSNGNYQYQCIA